MNDEDVLFCYRHPEKETYLHCRLCDKPICASCARWREAGYQCEECIKRSRHSLLSQRYTSRKPDYLLAVMIIVPHAIATPTIYTVIGFVIDFSILLLFPYLDNVSTSIALAAVGGILLLQRSFIAEVIAEAILWAVDYRRSRQLKLVSQTSFLISSFPALVFALYVLAQVDILMGFFLLAAYVIFAYPVMETLARKL